jgi:hypothetical protein
VGWGHGVKQQHSLIGASGRMVDEKDMLPGFAKQQFFRERRGGQNHSCMEYFLPNQLQN